MLAMPNPQMELTMLPLGCRDENSQEVYSRGNTLGLRVKGAGSGARGELLQGSEPPLS